jgi:hypothetical protein
MALEDVVASDLTWPKLKSISLDGINAQSEQLTSLFLRHKDILASVELSFILLPDLSWKEFLPPLREAISAKETRISLPGFFREQSEDREHEEELVESSRIAVSDYFQATGDDVPFPLVCTEE